MGEFGKRRRQGVEDTVGLFTIFVVRTLPPKPDRNRFVRRLDLQT